MWRCETFLNKKGLQSHARCIRESKTLHHDVLASSRELARTPPSPSLCYFSSRCFVDSSDGIITDFVHPSSRFSFLRSSPFFLTARFCVAQWMRRRRRRCRQESLRFSERFSFPPDISSAFARATSGARRRKRKKGRRSESRVGSNICARKSCDETGDFQMELLINNDNNNKKRSTAQRKMKE